MPYPIYQYSKALDAPIRWQYPATQRLIIILQTSLTVAALFAATTNFEPPYFISLCGTCLVLDLNCTGHLHFGSIIGEGIIAYGFVGALIGAAVATSILLFVAPHRLPAHGRFIRHPVILGLTTAVLLAVIVAGNIFGGIYPDYRMPVDKVLIQNFKINRDGFARLANWQQQHPTACQNSTDAPPPAVLQATSVYINTQKSSDDCHIEYQAWGSSDVSGWLPSDQDYKGYLYSPMPPNSIVSTFDTNVADSTYTNYIHLEGNWYLYHVHIGI